MPSSQKEEIGETFDDIELTEDEIEVALRIARKEKYFAQRRVNYLQELSKPKQGKKFSTGDLMDFFSKQFSVDVDNGEAVIQICQYFSGDNNFKGDLSKGLFLMGGVGVGKTTIMEFFQKNQVYSYRMKSCREVETDYANQGDIAIHKCSINTQIAVNSNPFGHQVLGWCFDDLGTEANAKHYGKDKNVMAEIILNRYDRVIECTHITTNLTAEQVTENYGSRVSDRIRGMFNIIKFPINAKSRR